MNQDLNPLEVPADKEDKRTADEDISFGEGNGEENGFGGANDIFNTSMRDETSAQMNTRKNNYDLEEEKGFDNYGNGDQSSMIVNFNMLL
jgi:hypothetical protein